MRPRILLALSLATVMLMAPAAAASYSNRLTDSRAHAGEVANTPDTDQRVGTRGWRAGVFMVGDSVTRIGLIEGLRSLKLGVGWEVSSVPGRDVSTLPYYLGDRLAAQQRVVVVKRKHGHRRRVVRYRYPLRTAIVALGANASLGWTYADLRDAVNALPRTTTVVFVTPYRSPTAWPNSGPYRVRASMSTMYTHWETRIAQLRKHTCVAEWGSFAARWPSALHDGVHQTDAGAKAWARIVADAVTRCS